ncbi:MAG: hydrogenase expression/formation protein HypE [Planctomycetota bacterium]
MRELGALLAQERIVLAHGGGGELMQLFIRERLLPQLSNPTLDRLTDSAVLPWTADNLVFTTDSFVVTPLEFPGGDIGRLAVCGTVNDLAVMGAEPIALSLGLILEEGLPLATLDRVLTSLADAAREAGVRIVTGDTKVIERRALAPGDEDQGEPVIDAGMLINTSGVGRMHPGVHLGLERIAIDDRIVVSGRIAEHGLAVMAQRDGLRLDTTLESDAAPLNGLIDQMLRSGADIRFLRDATRGGLAGVFADIRDATQRTLDIDESAVPVSRTARRAADWYGIDPLTVANEGVVVAVVDPPGCDRLLAAMHAHPLGVSARCIGRVCDETPPLIELRTALGGRRVLERPYGEDLPRIC